MRRFVACARARNHAIYWSSVILRARRIGEKHTAALQMQLGHFFAFLSLIAGLSPELKELKLRRRQREGLSPTAADNSYLKVCQAFRVCWVFIVGIQKTYLKERLCCTHKKAWVDEYPSLPSPLSEVNPLQVRFQYVKCFADPTGNGYRYKLF